MVLTETTHGPPIQEVHYTNIILKIYFRPSYSSHEQLTIGIKIRNDCALFSNKNSYNNLFDNMYLTLY